MREPSCGSFLIGSKQPVTAAACFGKQTTFTSRFHLSSFLYSMASGLETYVNRTVSVITADGRVIVGTLKGFDQLTNIIMEDSHERIYSKGQGVETVPLGLYIIRGENVSVVGEVDEEMDKQIDFSKVTAEPPNSVTHG